MKGCLAATCGLLLASCGAGPPSPPPPAKVTNTGFYEPILNLQIDLGEQGRRSGELIAQAGDEVARVGKDLIAGKAPVQGNIDTINFTVLGPAAADSPVGRKIVHFSMDAQELRELANLKASGDTMLASASEFQWWTPANDDVVADYCSTRQVSWCAGLD